MYICIKLSNYADLVFLCEFFSSVAEPPAFFVSGAGAGAILEDFRVVSEPEPGYLAGAGAITLARLRLHLKSLFNNSRKLHGTDHQLMSFLK